MGFRTPAKQLGDVGLREGFRSGLEEKVADQLRALGVEVRFEQKKVKYTKPARAATYTPDFELPNGVIIVFRRGILTPLAG